MKRRRRFGSRVQTLKSLHEEIALSCYTLALVIEEGYTHHDFIDIGGTR